MLSTSLFSIGEIVHSLHEGPTWCFFVSWMTSMKKLIIKDGANDKVKGPNSALAQS